MLHNRWEARFVEPTPDALLGLGVARIEVDSANLQDLIYDRRPATSPRTQLVAALRDFGIRHQPATLSVVEDLSEALGTEVQREVTDCPGGRCARDSPYLVDVVLW